MASNSVSVQFQVTWFVISCFCVEQNKSTTSKCYTEKNPHNFYHVSVKANDI